MPLHTPSHSRDDRAYESCTTNRRHASPDPLLCACKTEKKHSTIEILEVQVGDALLNGLELILLGLQIGTSVFYHLGRRLCEKKEKKENGNENELVQRLEIIMNGPATKRSSTECQTNHKYANTAAAGFKTKCFSCEPHGAIDTGRKLLYFCVPLGSYGGLCNPPVQREI